MLLAHVPVTPLMVAQRTLAVLCVPESHTLPAAVVVEAAAVAAAVKESRTLPCSLAIDGGFTKHGEWAQRGGEKRGERKHEHG